MILPSPMPVPAKRPPKAKLESFVPTTPPRTPTRVPLKRGAPEDDNIEERQPAKKLAKGVQPFGSPSKRKRLEDDGLVILEIEGEVVEDDDVIVLD